MAVIYITDQGSSISKLGDRIYIKKGSQTIRWILAKDIEQLILLGNIAITAQCVTYLLKNRIDTVFLTYYGKYKGRLVGEFGKNVFLRLDQFRFMESESLKIALTREYIRAKILNGVFVMKKRVAKLKNPTVEKSIIQNMAIIKYSLETANSIEELRGYEGIAARNYFAAFKYLVKNDDFVFDGRNKRPPKDEMNALLSLGYTLLMSQMLSKTYLVGLDPYYGSLHSLEYGRQSLVLDIMEEFRPFIDDLVLTLVNRREISKAHFKYDAIINEENEEEKRLPISLSQEGMKKFIYRYSKLLNENFYYTRLKSHQSFDKILLAQTRRLAAHFQNKGNYRGYLFEEGIKSEETVPH